MWSVVEWVNWAHRGSEVDRELGDDGVERASIAMNEVKSRNGWVLDAVCHRR